MKERSPTVAELKDDLASMKAFIEAVRERIGDTKEPGLEYPYALGFVWGDLTVKQRRDIIRRIRE